MRSHKTILPASLIDSERGGPWTQQELRELDAYIRRCADILGLRDWHLGIMKDEPDDEQAAAEIKFMRNRKHAAILLRTDFRTMHEGWRKQAVAHELVHCHVEEAWSIVQDIDWTEAGMHEAAAKVVEEIFDARMEYAVDAIADVVADMLPATPFARRGSRTKKRDERPNPTRRRP